MCTVKGDVATLTYGYHNLMRQIKRLILIIKKRYFAAGGHAFLKKAQEFRFPHTSENIN